MLVRRGQKVTARLNAHKSNLRRHCHTNRHLQPKAIMTRLNAFKFTKLQFGRPFEGFS